MLFNPDPQKQAQEVIFSKKTIKTTHSQIAFNNVAVVQSSYQKHLGVYLHQKLNFTHHIKEKVNKANKSIAVIKQLQTKLPQNALLTICKSFVRPHLDYTDIMYDQPNSDSFENKLEFNIMLHQLGLEPFVEHQEIKFIRSQDSNPFSLEKVLIVYVLSTKLKKKQTGLPSYLSKLIPDTSPHCLTRSVEKILTYHCRTESFKSSFVL